MRERESDPVDPEQRPRDRHRCAAALGPCEDGEEQDRNGAHRHLEDLSLAPEPRREHHPGQRGEPDERDRSPAPEHPVELVQADAADRDHEQRERQSAEIDEHDRDDRRRHGDEDPGDEIGALALGRGSGGGRRLLLRALPGPVPLPRAGPPRRCRGPVPLALAVRPRAGGLRRGAGTTAPRSAACGR